MGAIMVLVPVGLVDGDEGFELDVLVLDSGLLHHRIEKWVEIDLGLDQEMTRH